MRYQPHLLVDITPHGYGHISQTSAVVNELVRLKPDLRVTIRTSTPHEYLQSRFQCDFTHIPLAFDFGMKMANAVDVQVTESAASYREFHADWESKVEHEAHEILLLKPDLLLANAPYLSLAAARKAGVHAVGMCCLTWADIYRHYCSGDASSDRIHKQILAAYQGADCFLKVQPAMDMADLNNTLDIQPIVRFGQMRRSDIAGSFHLPDGVKLVLVAMGGIDFRLPVNAWPHLPGVRWIVPQAWQARRVDMIAYESLQMNFADVLASSDAVITKPGYGTFTEAAYAGVPVLYVTRRDWPEEPYLVRWLKENGTCLEVDRAVLHKGELDLVLQQLWSQGLPPRPNADGASQAARLLLEKLI
jgi:hypothetical protein